MKKDQRQRLLRIVSATILANLEEADLVEVLSLLSVDSEFGFDLSKLLSRLNDAMATPVAVKGWAGDETKAGLPAVEILLDDIQKRRIPKKILLSFVPPKLREELDFPANPESISVREIVGRVLERANAIERFRFLARIGIEPEDPYLRGIVDASQRRK
jgi:hypothetical protein